MAENYSKEDTPLPNTAPMCIVCGERPQFEPGSRGIGGALCLVCYYDL
jgi:hypothetical protein